MTKQTVYLHNFTRKSGFRLQLSEAVCLLNSPLLERSDDLSNNNKCAMLREKGASFICKKY